MQPALNPAYAPWECWRNGTATTCHGAFEESWVNQPWEDVDCDGRPIYGTGGQERWLTRHGDAEGRALWSKAHVEIREVISLHPDGSGPTMVGVGLFAQTFEYGIPGDFSTRTETYQGLDARVTAPGIGLIQLDTGIKTFDIEGNVLFIHGHHDVVDDFEGSMQQICDAFDELGA
jgi:hypothetical protein